jgi:hypothetical protein
MENNLYVFKTNDGIEFNLPAEILNMLTYIASHINGKIFYFLIYKFKIYFYFY